MGRATGLVGYIWNSKKKNFKYHIGTATGTLCKLENGVGSLEKLDSCSEKPPAGRAACSICVQQKAKWEKWGKEAEKGWTKKPSRKQAKEFYQSWEWKRVRYEAIKKYGRECMCCGATKHIVVDHIKPVRKYPELKLELDNLQILCDECNRGKSCHDETDWRPAA